MQHFRDIHGFNHFDLTFCKNAVVEKYLQGESIRLFKDVIATAQASSPQNQQKHTIFYAAFCKEWMFFLKIDPIPGSALNLNITFRIQFYKQVNIDGPTESQPTKIELSHYDPKTDIPWAQEHALKHFATLNFQCRSDQDLETVLKIKNYIANAK